ncbi:hypothetical protein OAS19_02635 [Altererythrobacter sp.]|nr:hypothetical protein [Altererythrobacter sp.]
MVASDNPEQDRRRLVELAMQVTERRGEEIGRAALAAEAGVSRALVDRHFPEESDLFNAIIELWYEPDIAIMEEVVASDLPVERKFYEFFARRFVRERERYEADPATFALYCELGSNRFEDVRGYIDLADHYLSELIAQAQHEGFFPELSINQALTLINQMVIAYTSPQVMMMIAHRLEEDKLATIIDTLFAGLAGGQRGAKGVTGLRAAS